MSDKQPLCPICRKPTEAKFRPFCSARCANVDLGRWFSETYSVPAPAPAHEPEAAEDDDFTG